MEEIFCLMREEKKETIFLQSITHTSHTHFLDPTWFVRLLVPLEMANDKQSEAVKQWLTSSQNQPKTKQTRQLLQFTLHQFSMLNTHTHTQINTKAFAIINIILISRNLFLTCKLALHIHKRTRVA